MLNVYGRKNCDTCRKALKWLTAEGIEHQFSDLRADGFDAKDLQRWLDVLGWEDLINRRGTTWRNLDDAATAGLDNKSAAKLIAENPALMKRPIFDHSGTGSNDVFVGFKTDQQDRRKAL